MNPAGISVTPDTMTTELDWRLHKHADYQRVYKSSRKQFSSRMTYFVAVQPQDAGCSGSRVGITAGRVLGKAVERNRIKRRMRAAIRCHFAMLPPQLDIVLHPKRTVMDAPWVELSAEMQRIFTGIRKTASASASSASPTPELGS